MTDEITIGAATELPAPTYLPASPVRIFVVSRHAFRLACPSCVVSILIEIAGDPVLVADRMLHFCRAHSLCPKGSA